MAPAFQRPSAGFQVLALLGWLAVTFLAAWLGSLGSAEAPDFYASLAKPSWAPPAHVFGPVWTVLYLAMGTAAWMVWRRRGLAGARGVFVLYLGQLALNALWSWLFFRWQLGAAAFVEILVLFAAVAATLWQFWRLHRGAGVLLLPYLAWVGFASALTWAVWQLNPGVL